MTIGLRQSIYEVTQWTMYSLVIFALLGWRTCSSSSVTYYSLFQAEEHFKVFIQQYNKTYDSEHEKQTRFEIFKKNLMLINQMNSQSTNAVYGITKFMDLTKNEFLSQYTGLKLSSDSSCKSANISGLLNVKSPEDFDWRKHSAVTRVKDQEGCASCWAFSTTGNIEGQYAIKHKQLQEFSEQQLVDCVTENANGCGGGFMAGAMVGLMKEGGSELEQDYPYTAQDGTCNLKPNLIKAKVLDCYVYDLQSEDKLKDIVYQTGPVSIGIKSISLSGYINGIVDAKTCDVGKLDHAVLLVGYGVENGTPYWIVKNSWSGGWGEQGYFRMVRGTNTCGLMNPLMAMAVVA